MKNVCLPGTFLLLVYSLIASPLWAASIQTSTGTVRVCVTSEGIPLVGAVVHVGGLESVTDESGVAVLSVGAGLWTLLVEAPGYQSASFSAEVAAQGAAEITVELVPRIQIVEEIFVSATRTERRLEDQPVRIEVVDRDEIEEKALMTPGSVAMLLGETTGLRVQTTSPSLGAANVRIQGLRGRYSQVLSDGLPLYGLQGDSLSLLQVPPLDLGQVEVIKGAASALYGPSALGGLINLVSQKPEARHRELLLNGSTQEAGDLSFWLVEPARNRWALTLLGGLHSQARQDLDGDGWADLPAFSRGVVRPRLFWNDESGRSVFATLGLMTEDRRGGTMPEGSSPEGSPFPQFLDSRRVDGGTVARFPVGNQGLVTLKGSVSFRSEARTFGEAFERGRRNTALGEVVYQGQSGRNVWLIGSAIQYDGYRNEDLDGFDFGFVVPALIGQDEISLSERVTLGFSARLDAHSRYGIFASPRVSLLYKPTAEITARASMGTGFFAPTPFVEETEETGFARLLPLDGLMAERARSASFDLSWGRGPLEFVMTVFGSGIEHPLERVFEGDERVAIVNAPGPVHTWGTEFLGRFREEGFVLLATYNFTSSTEQDPESHGRRAVPLTPRHAASLNAIWEGESWGRFGLEAYFVGRQPLEYNPYRNEGRSYLLVGALAERRFGFIRVFVNLENLTNVRQTRWEPLVRPDPLPDGRWTVDAWAPLDGRVANAGVRIFF